VARKKYDVFVSHATEDKKAFVKPLVANLITLGLKVWYDELTLRPGDSLSEKIDAGLSDSRYGVVILSPSFFSKQWARRELRGLVQKATSEGKDLILPVWHGVTHTDVAKHSLPLADLLALNSKDGVADVAKGIAEVVLGRDLSDAKGPPVAEGKPVTATSAARAEDEPRARPLQRRFEDLSLARRPLAYASGIAGFLLFVALILPTSVEWNTSRDARVPSLVGLSELDARALAMNQGWTVIGHDSNEWGAKHVVNQEPSANTVLRRGSEVAVWYSPRSPLTEKRSADKKVVFRLTSINEDGLRRRSTAHRDWIKTWALRIEFENSTSTTLTIPPLVDTKWRSGTFRVEYGPFRRVVAPVQTQGEFWNAIGATAQLPPKTVRRAMVRVPAGGEDDPALGLTVDLGTPSFSFGHWIVSSK